MLREVNRILDSEQLTMHSVHIADADPDFRMVFSVDGQVDEQKVFSVRLHESTAFATVTTLGSVEHD
jgi:6-phosphogluconolactonase (cycloisomerase 2 family)